MDQYPQCQFCRRGIQQNADAMINHMFEHRKDIIYYRYIYTHRYTKFVLSHDYDSFHDKKKFEKIYERESSI